MGISFAGTSTGVIILPLISEKLISTYGWRGALLVQGSMTLNIVVTGMLFKPVTKPPKLKRAKVSETRCAEIEDKMASKVSKTNFQNKTSSSLCSTTDLIEQPEGHGLSAASDNGTKLETGIIESTKSGSKYPDLLILLLDTPIILVALFATFLVSVSYIAALTHIANQVSLMGFSDQKSASVLSSIGIGGTFGRVFHGWLVDRKLLKSTTLYEIALLLAAVGTLINPVSNTYYGYVISAIIIGFTAGIMYPLFYTLLRQMVGLEQLATATGLTYLFDGFGYMAGGYLAGTYAGIDFSWR